MKRLLLSISLLMAGITSTFGFIDTEQFKKLSVAEQYKFLNSLENEIETKEKQNEGTNFTNERDEKIVRLRNNYVQLCELYKNNSLVSRSLVAAKAHPVKAATAGVSGVAGVAGSGYAAYRFGDFGKLRSVATKAPGYVTAHPYMAGTAGAALATTGIGYALYRYGKPAFPALNVSEKVNTLKAKASTSKDKLQAMMPSVTKRNAAKATAVVTGLATTAGLGYAWYTGQLANVDVSTYVNTAKGALSNAKDAVCGFFAKSQPVVESTSEVIVDA